MMWWMIFIVSFIKGVEKIMWFIDNFEYNICYNKNFDVESW